MTAWAVGLIEYTGWPGRVDRTQARVTLAAHARHAGLLLIDTVETSGAVTGDPDAIQRLRAVIGQILAQKAHAVVLTNASLDLSKVDPGWTAPTVIAVPLMGSPGPETPPEF